MQDLVGRVAGEVSLAASQTYGETLDIRRGFPSTPRALTSASAMLAARHLACSPRLNYMEG